MKRNIRGKNILALLLALVLALTCAACGSDDQTAQTEAAASPLAGCWVCTGMDIGLGMMDAEEIQSLYGSDGSEVMTLELGSGNAATFCFFGDKAAVTWTETDSGCRLTAGEDPDFSMELTLGEDGTLTYAEEADGISMTFLLTRTETRPAVLDREPQEEPQLSLPGFWTCTSLDMGSGEAMDAEEIQSLFEIGADEFMSLRVKEDGTAYLIFFGEAMGGTWEQTDYGMDLIFNGEEVTQMSFFDWGDGTLEYSMEEDGVEFDVVLSKSDAVPEAFGKNPLTLLDVRFTPEQSIDLSNFMLSGRYAFLDGKLYGYYSESSTDRRLISYDYDPTQPKESRLTGFTQMDEGGTPCFLQMANGYLYYICMGDDGSTLRRINPDGSGKTVLYDRDCNYLQVCGDTMYFTDENYRLVSANLDGQNVTTLIDKDVYFPYCLGDGWFLFQDDADGESLHIANPEAGYEQRLSTDKVYGYALDGEYLYFVDVDDYENYTGHLTRINLATMETEVSETVMNVTVLIADCRIWSESYGISEETENWMRLEDGSWDHMGYKVVYIDEDTRICWYINERNNIEQYAIYAGDTFTTF